MTGKYTPAPWEAKMYMIGDSPRWFIQFDGPIIKDSTIASMNSTCAAYDNAKADAKLIAAAPELLEALRGLLILPQVDGTHAANRAKEIIAKAEGRL